MALPPPVNRQDEYLHHIAGLLAEQNRLLGQLADRLAPAPETTLDRVQISEPARREAAPCIEPATPAPAPPPTTNPRPPARAGRRTSRKGT